MTDQESAPMSQQARFLSGLRRVFPAVAVLVLAACQRQGTAASYDTALVTRGDIEQHVTASGTLSAVVSVDVGSQVSGKIAVLNVDFNSPVKKGQLIAEIDPSVYVAALQQAQGDLASAEANVVLKNQNLKRKKILAPQRAASQLDLDQAIADLAQARATVTIKRAVVDSAKANLSYCKITSPVTGVVISRKVDVGQTLVAAMTTPVLFTIAQDIRKMHISAAVSESDIGQVKSAEAVNFTVDAFPDKVFEGTVTQVRKAATTTSNVVTYETIIDVDNPEQKLFPGMTADISILVAQKKNVLKVSNAALRYTPPADVVFEKVPPVKLESRQRLAYSPASDGANLSPRVLTIGLSDGVETEVVGGATVGTAMIISARSPGAARSSFGPPSGGPPPQ
jgi:HlyD family secretion protein